MPGITRTAPPTDAPLKLFALITGNSRHLSGIPRHQIPAVYALFYAERYQSPVTARPYLS